ncbi:MFS transporter [Goodfellowiella coeruleoviolacea]|uniref:MFS transporter, DHA2 family, methylenomycin A resistance protein n=1 Tax=Goodfellowiella coeruleoviolacea TaxID=334858 RepID=A0AAE3G8A4_9PSEU|nr:MFS transporter [Goodfellowiella coeruleoviolacea]MCP2163556.1 MFS transporter, DHA2 family, methylenomycin A resistance protein [Goodfellowiella coeruleoviolacea]
MNTQLTAQSTSPVAPHPVATTTSARSRWTLLAASFGFLMVSLDATIVNVALPTLGRELGAGLSQLQWVVDGYTLTFAALQLSGGSLGDRMGARRAFAVGLSLFVLASLLCGLAASPGMLIAARFAQGVGAAVQLPASLAMIRHAYPDAARRNRAVGVWAAAGGAAVAAGPVLGGLLLVWLGWRSLFLVNLVIGAVGLAATALADSTPAGGKRRLDLPGQVAVMLALSALTFALIEGGTVGWTAPPVLAALLVAVAGGVVFVWWERRAPEPMLPMSLFGHPVIPAASVAGFAQNFAYYGIVFLLSLFLQGERGESALATGLIFLPMSIAAMAANLLGGRLTSWLGPRSPMLAGQFLFALGLLGLLVAGPSAANWLIWLATVPVGLGAGMVVPAMTSAVLETVEPGYAGVAAAELNTARQVGGAVGVALFGTLVVGDFLAGLRLSLAIAAAALVGSALVTARRVRLRRG